jgi:hypothetical protein
MQHLKNAKAGTRIVSGRLRRQEIVSSGKHPKRFVPPLMFLEK